MAYFNYYIKYTFYLFVLSHACACTIILGEINAFANSTGGNTTMGARGEGGARGGAQSPHPPLKNQGNFLPVIWGNFCFIFPMWGLFYYVFLIIVIALRGGGGNSRQSPPFKKSAICMDAFLLPFRCLFFHVRAFLLRFSHYNFALAEGGGGEQDLAFAPP